MILERFAWFREYVSVIRIAKAVARAKREGRLACEDCGCYIHKRDRYSILAVRHTNCMDTKLVGQQSFLEIK